MSGDKESAAKTRATMVAKHGSEAAYRAWMAANGRKGKVPREKTTFYRDPELARRAGAIARSNDRGKV